VAKWQGKGLQNPDHGFKSHRRLWLIQMTIIPTLLPIPDAAQKYGLDETRLRDLVQAGKIHAGEAMGEILVYEKDIQKQAKEEEVLNRRKEDLPEFKKYLPLRGIGIGIAEAVEKYGLNASTIHRWFKHGIIAEIKWVTGLGGKKILLDEADIAYCAEINKKFGGQGKRVFRRNGIPFRIKKLPLA
jgi:hypothetical protein